MELCKSGQIQNCCHPNALMTLKEFLIDYASEDTGKIGEAMIEREIDTIPKEKVRDIVRERLVKIENGERDFRF
jgi:2-iminoacetate synthase